MNPSPSQIAERLREAARLSTLDASRRLEAKIDMSPAAIASRLREASDLLALCVRLAARTI